MYQFGVALDCKQPKTKSTGLHNLEVSFFKKTSSEVDSCRAWFYSVIMVDVVPLVYFWFCFPCLRRHIQNIIAKTSVKKHHLCFLLEALWFRVLFVVVVQSLSCIWPFVTPWSAACLSNFSILHYLLEFAQVRVHWVGDAIYPSHPLSPLSPLPSVFPNIRVFSNEQVLHIKWPKYWSFSFSISPSNVGTLER